MIQVQKDSKATFDKLELFRKKEELIYKGLCSYLECNLGEYLTPEQLAMLCTMMRDRRMARERDFAKEMISPITLASSLRNQYIPMKKIRKEDLATLMYNMGPYMLAKRIHVAWICKQAFPNIFTTVKTVNSMFGRSHNMFSSALPRQMDEGIKLLPQDQVEYYLYELGQLEEEDE